MEILMLKMILTHSSSSTLLLTINSFMLSRRKIPFYHYILLKCKRGIFADIRL